METRPYNEDVGCGGCSVGVVNALDLCPLFQRGWIGSVFLPRRVFCLCRSAGRRGRRPLRVLCGFVRAFSCQPAPHLMRGGEIALCP
ncbi:MAG: hypothetical protein FWB93_04825 [Oscillospiraceae bacterium]|nr:hypothetical protein [Oscillospiraceae bacterium]